MMFENMELTLPDCRSPHYVFGSFGNQVSSQCFTETSDHETTKSLVASGFKSVLIISLSEILYNETTKSLVALRTRTFLSISIKTQTTNLLFSSFRNQVSPQYFS